ncbi:MAG: hypothetical protein IKU26_00685 [Clostridia bacterium]|nr:hypothetical protein [Clostridia bacterium]
MADYMGGLKLCGTCACWIGMRDVDSINMSVKNCASQGKCGNPYGGFRNSSRESGMCGCNSYQKWPALK